MLLTLFNMVDGDNVINKTLIDGYDLNINLKAETDVINPSFVLRSIEDIDFNNFNYCFIPFLKRYYFIDTVSSVNAQLWRFNLSCDVLQSYKNDILLSQARLRRNIRNGDYIDVNIDKSIIKTASLHNSDVTIGDEKSVILTTVGA